MALTTGTDNQTLLDAQLELWHTTFAYIKSMALKSALDLRIADAIHGNGGAATLPQIFSNSSVTLHPSKIPCLRRLMRVLTSTGIFTVVQPRGDEGSDELTYGLTPASQLLVGSQSQTPFMSLLLHGIFVSPFLGLGTWLQQHEHSDTTLFEMTHGQTLWDLNDHNPAFGALFNSGMVCDSSFITDIVVKECGHVFQGLSSLTDVAGGLGASVARPSPSRKRSRMSCAACWTSLTLLPGFPPALVLSTLPATCLRAFHRQTLSSLSGFCMTGMMPIAFGY
ncbi:unnamed protein product [Urochloa humidicola]